MAINTYMRFPEGLSKAITLSYDDGKIFDEKLVEILNQYGLKCTFNINSGFMMHERGNLTFDEAKKVYNNGGHEVALHSYTHAFLEQLPMSLAVRDISVDRSNLEREFGRIVRGMAYPNGPYDDEVVEAARACGIVYSRTTTSSHNYEIPTDWLRLKPTCHHLDPEFKNLYKEFFAYDMDKTYNKKPLLFYLWGHSYEFVRDKEWNPIDRWNVIEEFAKEASKHKDSVWFATNMEIYDYVKAYNELVFSIDGTLVHNPTNTDVWFLYQTPDFAEKKLIKVEKGATVEL